MSKTIVSAPNAHRNIKACLNLLSKKD